MTQFFDVVIRALLLFLVIMVLTYTIGRKYNTQLTFFDYVIGTTLGSIASSLLANQSLRLDFGLISLAVWTVCIVILSGITFASIPARKLIDGEPTMVIYNGQILENNLKARRYNVNDLLMQLRTKGVFNPNEIEVAIIEANGQLSILKKSQYKQ